MGRKGRWFGAVKKVFSPESKGKSNQRNHNKWASGKSELVEHETSSLEVCEAPAAADPPPPIAPREAVLKEANANAVRPIAIAAVETTEITPQVPNQVVSPTSNAMSFAGKTEEEIAATKIQTAFRGYLARRALRAMKGLVRLKSLLHGNAVKRQSATTLKCMQTLAKVQTQIRARRIRMTEENQALQRQLQLKREKELEALRASMGEDWDDSLQSKEQIEASLVSKHEAAIRRERALAYAFSHQWKNSSRSVNPLFTDPSNPHWGWSWLERWMAARPWETRSLTEKDDNVSVRSAVRSVGGETNKAPARREATAPDMLSPAVHRLNTSGRRSPSPSISSKPSPAVGRAKQQPSAGFELATPEEEETKSLASVQSERIRRHSLAGSSARDDESLASSPALPRYMVSTQSAKAKSRLQSPSADKLETPEKPSVVGSVKKRLSFPSGDKAAPSPAAAARRHSGPPKMDLGSSGKTVPGRNGDGR